MGRPLAAATVLLPGVSASVGAAAAPVVAGRGAIDTVEWTTSDADAYLAGVAEMTRGAPP